MCVENWYVFCSLNILKDSVLLNAEMKGYCDLQHNSSCSEMSKSRSWQIGFYFTMTAVSLNNNVTTIIVLVSEKNNITLH